MTLQEFIDDCRQQRDQRRARERQQRRDAEAARLATIPAPLRPFIGPIGDALAADLVITAPGLAEIRVSSAGMIRIGGKTFTDFVEAVAFASDTPTVTEVKEDVTLPIR